MIKKIDQMEFIIIKFRSTKMNKTTLGILLILMMFGHNYVLNQPQVLQAEFQQIHNVTVTEFNLLYSLPSAIAIFFILPLGILYDKYAQIILVGSGLVLALGQLIVAIFGANSSSFAFPLLTAGRVLQGTTAEVLYMIQANLSSSWMGKLAGLTLILPEIGQIVNVFLTLEIREKLGVSVSLFVGFITCLISFIACVYLYRQLKRHKKLHEGAVKIMEQGEKQLNMLQDPSQEKQMQEIKKKPLKNGQADKKNNDPKNESILESARKILKAGEIFWFVVILCAINECLYFPFLDNAKVLIQKRFCVPQERTSFYLCIPYLSAIMLSVLVGEQLLYKYSRHKLIFASSLLPLIGHSIIYFIDNCESETTYFEEIFLIAGFILFGMGIAGYYSISMPAVGLAVPQNIRGTAFACLGFLQTLTMTAVPLISGTIIEQDSVNNDNYIQGYRNSSFFFVFLCLSASTVSLIIMMKATPDSFKYVEDELIQMEFSSTSSVSVTKTQEGSHMTVA